MKYAYYPGCSAHSTARDMHESTVAVAHALGIKLVEPAGWTCCGATAAHQTDRLLAAALPAANLLLAKEQGLDMMVTCAACYNRMKTANYEVRSSAAIRERVNDAIGHEYDGSVAVRHFVEVLLQDVGTEKIRKSLQKSLDGLKVACYYGCLLVRPPEITKFDDTENPESLESLVTAMGGESLDWPGKVECCGGGLNLTRTDVVIKLSGSIIDSAKASGADCIVTACPMCQASLDLRQKDIEKATGKPYGMPVIYITQLLGLCLGIAPKELGLERLMVSPAKVVERIMSATPAGRV
ncbi:MAG: CoB--CoM heterodisulfide reductase iron-sulfur subunit B family protein [Dehalococcoidales bacterium]|nr:CoB--CoM heterodisulfide reductase iron-sulfur subunit B family protein [Dehalococcoidales bacterium]